MCTFPFRSCNRSGPAGPAARLVCLAVGVVGVGGAAQTSLACITHTDCTNTGDPCDLTSNLANPDPVGTVCLGANYVRGAIRADVGCCDEDFHDAFRFTVPAGLIVTQMELVITNYVNNTTTTSRYRTFSSGIGDGSFAGNTTVNNIITAGPGYLLPGTYNLQFISGIDEFRDPDGSEVSYNWRLDITAELAGDRCETAVAVFDGDMRMGDLTGHTHTGEATCDSGSAGQTPDAWYTFTAPCSGTLTVDTIGSRATGGTDAGADTVLSLHSGCPGTEANQLACHDDIVFASNRDSLISQPLAAGETVLIRVSTWSDMAFLVGNGLYNLNVAFAETNDDCACATPIGDGTYLGSTSSATNDGSASCGASGSSPDVWYAYENATLNPVTVTADTIGGTNFDTVLSAHDGCGGAQVACNDDFGGLQSQIVWTVPAGATHLIRVAGFNGATGDFQLDVASEIANDACENAIAIGDGTYLGSNVGATNDNTPPCGDGGTMGADVWYAYTNAEPRPLTVTADTIGGTNFDTVLSALDACGSAALACNDDSGSLQSQMTWDVPAGATHLIRVAGYNTSTGDFQLDVTSVGCPCEFDGAAGVNVFDLLAYLALWFPMDAAADVDGSGAVDVFDLLGFLSCWFPASGGAPCP